MKLKPSYCVRAHFINLAEHSEPEEGRLLQDLDLKLKIIGSYCSVLYKNIHLEILHDNSVHKFKLNVATIDIGKVFSPIEYFV